MGTVISLTIMIVNIFFIVMEGTLNIEKGKRALRGVKESRGREGGERGGEREGGERGKKGK